MKVVYLEWNDAFCNTEWMSIDYMKEVVFDHDMIVRQAGFLVKETKKFVVFAVAVAGESENIIFPCILQVVVPEAINVCEPADSADVLLIIEAPTAEFAQVVSAVVSVPPPVKPSKALKLANTQELSSTVVVVYAIVDIVPSAADVRLSGCSDCFTPV